MNHHRLALLVLFRNDLRQRLLKAVDAEIHRTGDAAFTVVVGVLDAAIIVDCSVETTALVGRTRSHAGRLAKTPIGFDAHVMRTDVLFEHAVVFEFKRRDAC